MRILAALCVCLFFSGCIVLEPRAENPFPNMNSIAVVPFFNQSAMPGEVNDLGRTFGRAYAIELQKIPGYDVLPLGVVETAIIENDLQFQDERDVLELARILKVDAVVVGTITTYDPWYPPKVGMKVNWYSTKHWTIMPDGQPCGPCDESEWDENGECPCHPELPELRTKEGNSVIRGQNPGPMLADRAEPLFGIEPKISHPMTMAMVSHANRPLTAQPPAESVSRNADIAVEANSGMVSQVVPQRAGAVVQLQQTIIPVPDGAGSQNKKQTTSGLQLVSEFGHATPAAGGPHLAQQLTGSPGSLIPSPRLTPPPPAPGLEPPRGVTPPRPMKKPPIPLSPEPLPPELLPGPGEVVEFESDITKPVMSYTKMFDGKDDEIVQLLRDYVEIHGDRRSGGWEGYMQRTDDYIDFCCHVMIVDMLTLHGGGLKTKVWLKKRKSP